jgi:peptide deformylase
MAIREIVKYGDPILREQAAAVRRFDERLGVLLDDMAESMYAAEGVGLAAPQVGIPKAVVVVDIGEGLIELVNPRILSRSQEEEESVEGCLSLPGRHCWVPRALQVKVEAQDRTGKTFQIEGEGLLARAFQHEIDHLSGIVFIDKSTGEAEVEE